ncbi:MAG: cytochrome c peroxidase, partial [Verrucomicrobiota bacterium]
MIRRIQRFQALWVLPSAISLLLGMWCCGSSSATAAGLAIEVDARFNGAPLNFDAPVHLTGHGQRISVTRLDFLLSNLALHRKSGDWVQATNWFGYVSLRECRTNLCAPEIPSGTYDRVRLDIGVSSAENHANPAAYPAGHSLNPIFNGLHWGWQGGYVFMALEGHWMEASNQVNHARAGYSFHIATDPLRMSLDLPLATALDPDDKLRLQFHVDKVFSSIHRVRIQDESSSTHSREGDLLATALSQNIETAFSALCIKPAGSNGGLEKQATQQLMPL